MIKVFKQLWNDQEGFLLTTEAMILWTIAVLGVVTGFVAVRNAAVAERVEMANAVRSFDQSYSYSNLQGPNGARTNGAAATNLPTGNSAYGLTSSNPLVPVNNNNNNNNANVISVTVP